MLDESSVLQRVAGGDRTAVDDCIERYGSLIWSIGRRYIRDVTELEDLTQEIFVELWQKASRFDPNLGTEASFIAMIARRRSMDRVRRENTAKKIPIESFSDAMDEATVPPLDPVVWGEDMQNTLRCLDMLDQVRRDVLVMHLRDGRTHQCVAESLRLPLGTIKSHARRGLLQIRKCLGIQVDRQRVSLVSRGEHS